MYKVFYKDTRPQVFTSTHTCATLTRSPAPPLVPIELFSLGVLTPFLRRSSLAIYSIRDLTTRDGNLPHSDLGEFLEIFWGKDPG